MVVIALLQAPSYKPSNSWSPSKALAGQNDYIGESFLSDFPHLKMIIILMSYLWVVFNSLPTLFFADILGSEDLHPKHLLYHVPQYLKGVHRNEKHFQVHS